MLLPADAGPGPIAGTGIHRYAWLLFSQPSNFSAPANLSTPGVSPGHWYVNEYVVNSHLGALVAASFFTVQNGEPCVVVCSLKVWLTLLVCTAPLPLSRRPLSTPLLWSFPLAPLLASLVRDPHRAASQTLLHPRLAQLKPLARLCWRSLVASSLPKLHSCNNGHSPSKLAAQPNFVLLDSSLFYLTQSCMLLFSPIATA